MQTTRTNVTPEGFVQAPEAVNSCVFADWAALTWVTGIYMAEVYDTMRKLLGPRDRHLNLE